MLPDCFFYPARSLSSCYLQSLFISFKGFSGSVSLSRPNASKKSIAKLNIGKNGFSVINLTIGQHTVAGAVMFFGIFFKETVALDVLKVNLAEKRTRIVAGIA